MVLSDFSIKRPVVATVLSTLLFVFGIVAMLQLPIREAPDIERPVVSINVTYPGASAAIVETKVVQVLEGQISGVEGIKSINSSARDALGWISVEFKLGRDIDGAANDLRDVLSRAARSLPNDADPPTIRKADQDAQPIMWLNISSPQMDRLELSDYVSRYLIDRFTSIEGVASAWIGGERKKSLRVWFDRRAMAARGLTVADVENTLRRENVELGAGLLESKNRDFNLRTARSFNTPEDFARLVIARGENNYLVRLGEIAKVEIGPANTATSFRTDGKNSVGIGVIKRPGASTLAVAQSLRDEIEIVQATLPSSMSLVVNQDSSVFISAALREVALAMGIAALLVIAVIYLFLGTIRAVIIPAVTVPISLTATFIVLWPLGYSINILTLLALVLAIGLVVDDAIIMLENIHRRIKRGEPPLLAAYRGARQVGVAIVATTLVLIAVFVPITLTEGVVGRLFTEFAVTMAAAVTCSMFVALTLTPMMCSKILEDKLDETLLARGSMKAFEWMKVFYAKTLNIGLDRPYAVLAGFFAVVASSIGIFLVLPQEFTPPEDRGSVNIMIRAPEGASLEYTDRQGQEVTRRILKEYVEPGVAARVLQIMPMGSGVSGQATNMGNVIVRLEPWEKRDKSVHEILRELGPLLRDIPGAQIIPSPAPSFGQGRWGGGLGMVLGGSTYEELVVWRDIMLEAMAENPQIFGARSNYNETRPQMRIRIDQNRAADLGVSIGTVGQTLAVMLGSRRVTTFVDKGEEYDVILQGRDEDRRTPTDVTNIYVRSDTTRELVPLSSLITIEEISDAGTRNRYDRLRSITVMATPVPGYTMGEAMTWMEQVASERLPEAARVSWNGQAREYRESGNAMYIFFALSLLVVFLVLAAQFESFIHPLVIMMTVPLAVVGALAGLWVFGISFNIYSQIGLIVLIGLAAKNGILIVEFANQLRDTGYEFREALVEAATIRLRPIVMTALATCMGAVPLMLSSGAGAEGREAIGVVIFTGVAFSSFITLLVVPVFYQLLTRGTRSPGAVAADLVELEKKHPGKENITEDVIIDGTPAE
ncbi:MAG: efflux RND transporter permease subunit [Rhodospirillaceae bacterium]|nr:efflux RND transporter permease subunit [Rhodospirillaceae bacterium]